MSLRNILNHPASPVASAVPSSVSPTSPSSTDSPAAPKPTITSEAMPTSSKQKVSSAPKLTGELPKRYLDRVLDSDALEDLQPDALPAITKHPYPEPEGYASSDNMDLDDFAEVWSDSLNQYMVSCRRKEQLLEKGYDEWESGKQQETAARVTGWAGEQAEHALRLKRARVEQRRLQEEERLCQERNRCHEEGLQRERDEAAEVRKRRKKELAEAAKARNRERRRLAKEESDQRKAEELAKVQAIRAEAEAHEQRQREEERAKAERARSEAQTSQPTKPLPTYWFDDLHKRLPNPFIPPDPNNPQVNIHGVPFDPPLPEAYVNHIRMMAAAPKNTPLAHEVARAEREEAAKARVPSNLANLLNSPGGHSGGLSNPHPAPAGPKASRANPRVSATSTTAKRKRGPPEPLVHPAEEAGPEYVSQECPAPAIHHPPASASSSARPPNSQGARRTVSGLPSQAHLAREKSSAHGNSVPPEMPYPPASTSKLAFETSQSNHPSHIPPTRHQAQPPQSLIDPATRRLQARNLPAWGHNLPYGSEPYQDSSDQLDMSLPLRERAVANPKALANKRWDAIEEGRRQIWLSIARKDIPRVCKTQQSTSLSRTIYSKRLSALVSREARRIIARTKASKEVQIKAKRIMRELLVYYRSNEKRERETKRKADKEAIDRAKKDDEMREVKRQARKLNFLITQTELYSHFVGNKIKTKEAEDSADTAGAAPATVSTDQTTTISSTSGQKVELSDITQVAIADKDLGEINFDDDDEFNLHAHAARNALKAVDAAKQRAQAFDHAAAEKLAATAPSASTSQDAQPVTGIDIDRDDLNFQNPTMAGDIQVKQPKLLMAELKEYQLKGLNWLANLYEQGINGILADEMGLGKTVQSISLMAYLAEVHNIWGPFLVIAPASTLHNWQQEITRFVPALKPIPYWGSVKDRTILRKFWNRKHLRYDRDAPFHVVITSYQLVVQDEKYFQTLKWQYMILDEAQAIKSSSSTRWKTLLGFHCRNRLLLTGTPIQNSMTELWALLHFIMPQLFDSHEEFSEWFSKDIENSVDKAGGMNEHQLRRLHMILKPFMLRRIKKNVQNELGDKIEIDVACGLTPRQKLMYSRLRENMSIADLVQKATSLSNDDAAVKRLMNLIMQFRKVCNHPELFERADVTAPLSFASLNFTANVARDGDVLDCPYATRSLIQSCIPRAFYRDGGILSVPGPSSRAGFDTKFLDRLMNIWSVPNVMKAGPEGSVVPSWAKMLDLGPGEVEHIAHGKTAQRIPHLLRRRNQARELALGAQLPDSIASDLETLQIFIKSDLLPRIPNDLGTTQLSEITEEFRKCSRMNRSDVQTYNESVVAPPPDLYCADRGFELEQQRIRFDPMTRLFLFGLPHPAQESPTLSERYRAAFSGTSPAGVMGMSAEDQLPRSFMQVPLLEKLMLDSGKLARLDSLLQELKTGGHRVLIYFQMTRMIDLMEEYLSFRHYRYLRLDGSSTISERRDMVMDWQNRPEIFIFLLSTRAGGLGINLTAADTVIFYDCDWNPSNDQQAMDRAHRLGQKRQVTVYRLITTGTIDERILKLARTKKTVQDAVVGSSSGNAESAAPGEAAKPNEVVSLLLDEEELEAGMRAQAAKREAAKEKQVQSGLRGVKIREERKAAAAANQSGSMSIGWSNDGLNLEEDDEEAFGFFTTEAKAGEEPITGEPGTAEPTGEAAKPAKSGGKKRKSAGTSTATAGEGAKKPAATKAPAKKTKAKSTPANTIPNPPPPSTSAPQAGSLNPAP
ncbi:putative DNA helicase ino80 [Puccinia graminis f. sp. tritici]|uniref:Chromatin-remodeling ATPase INO80 n=1 Tax=Puccinia graminis f. sp. tritici TaxID=56615 RepID=A0A5B0RJE0_PUCGR|nr:putative DNA helicase ino80 [Puccinia graminis f. sp. tritici]KAA1125499.1 putative DNA helicase ino80 [Puccinia graminis f. sp. tritici]